MYNLSNYNLHRYSVKIKMTRYRRYLFNEISFDYRIWIYIVYTCYMNANGHVHMHRGGKRSRIFRY